MGFKDWLLGSQPVEERSTYSVSDPLLAQYFNAGPVNLANVPVNETTALGLSAVWRAVSLISQTIASLPMRTLRENKDGTREEIPSFLDDPGTIEGQTQFEWVEQMLVYLLLHGGAPLLHVRNGAGGLAGLVPVHPLSVTVDWDKDSTGRLTGRKVFDVQLVDGTRPRFTQDELTYIPALTLDGLTGVSPIWMARNSLGTSIAGDRAAAKLFGSGALIQGLVTPEEDITEEEATTIKAGLDQKMTGVDNAGAFALINRKLKFQPWTMSAEDAQFLGSRAFQIEEVARWFGVPPHLLMQTDKQTSWGTGVAEQNRGLSRTVLTPWCNRIEQRLSRLLPRGTKVEFDLTGLERGNPEGEIGLLIQQVQAGLLTIDEARRIRNLPPLPVGDGAAPESPPEAPGSPEVAA